MWASFVKWFVGLFIHEIIDQIKNEIEKPSTLADANTPHPLVVALRNQLDSELRDKSCNCK